jgi:transcriptional regulator with XRE-family HTH domain
MEDLTAQRVAATVRAEMARRRVRQTALAKHLDLSQAAVSRRLNGETEFAVGELLAVADLLGVSAASLLAEPADAGSAA